MFAKRPLSDIVLQTGTWAISDVPTHDWARGLQRIARYAARHTKETGVKIWLSMVTPVNVQDSVHTFTSPQRVRRFNQMIWAIATQHSVPVLDTWAPLDAREDSRVDRVHLCPQMRPEWAGQVLAGMCA